MRTKNHQTPDTSLVGMALKRQIRHHFSEPTPTYMGAISEPCCNIAPVANHTELDMLNWLMRNSGSSTQGNGLFHSSGQIRPSRKKERETTTKAIARAIQVSMAKGSAKEKKLGGALVGF